jgi:neutral ceramidase
MIFLVNMHCMITETAFVYVHKQFAVHKNKCLFQGASTLYGPHSLSAYIQEFQKLAAAMVGNKDIPTNFQPPDLLNKQIGLLPGVMFDSTTPGVKFGDVSSDVPANSTFRKGSIVNATFHTACPRNDLLTDGTFALIEKLEGNNWVPAYDDDDWSLCFKWSRPARLSPKSFATLKWTIPEDAPSGVYRFRHFGASKPLIGSIRHFTGTSRAFMVR